jgi:phage gp45-like
MIARAIVKLVNATTGCQTLQLAVEGDDDPTDDDIEDFQPFGVSFKRSIDDEALLFAVAGDSAHQIAMGSSGRGKRPTVDTQAGEGGLYLDGTYRVFLKADGTVRLGKLTATEPAMLGNATKTYSDSHAHATPFGPTGAPITPMPSTCLSTAVYVADAP